MLRNLRKESGSPRAIIMDHSQRRLAPCQITTCSPRSRSQAAQFTIHLTKDTPKRAKIKAIQDDRKLLDVVEAF